MARVSASSRWAMRATRPGSVLAWWSCRPIWRLRVANTDSMTSRMRALAVSAGGRWEGLCLAGVISWMSISCIEDRYSRPARPPSTNSTLPGCAAARSSGVAFLTGLGADEVIADRDALGICQQHQAHAPDELALGRAVAVGGVPGELAVALAARVVRARAQRPVGEPDVAVGDEFGEHQLHRGEPRRQPPQPAVVLRLIGQIGKEAGQQALDRAQKPAIRDGAGDRLSDRERDDLLIADLPDRTRTREPERRREHVRCDRQGLQRSAHLVLQSRGCRAGDPVLMSTPHSCPAAQPTSSLY